MVRVNSNRSSQPNNECNLSKSLSPILPYIHMGLNKVLVPWTPIRHFTGLSSRSTSHEISRLYGTNRIVIVFAGLHFESLISAVGISTATLRLNCMLARRRKISCFRLHAIVNSFNACSRSPETQLNDHESMSCRNRRD